MIINMNGAKAPETPSPVLQEKTVTPETLPTVIGPDEGYDGLSQVTVNPDSQLIPTNIRSGKTIFGVTGTFGDGDSVTASDIVFYPGIADYALRFAPGLVGNIETISDCENGTYVGDGVQPKTSEGTAAISFGNTFMYGSSAFDKLSSSCKYYSRVTDPVIPARNYNATLSAKQVDGYATMPVIPGGTRAHIEADIVYKPAILYSSYGDYVPLLPVSETTYSMHVALDLTVGYRIEFPFEIPSMSIEGVLECASPYKHDGVALGYNVILAKTIVEILP